MDEFVVAGAVPAHIKRFGVVVVVCVLWWLFAVGIFAFSWAVYAPITDSSLKKLPSFDAIGIVGSVF